MFYDNFIALCSHKGVSPSRAAIELGISKSTVTRWKQNAVSPSMTVLQKIADYFNVPISALLQEQKKVPTAKSSEPDDEFIILARKAKHMTPEQRKKLIDMTKVLFGDDFWDDEEDDDDF